MKDKTGDSASVTSEKKSLTIASENGTPVLTVTNEYGNSVRYEISQKHQFDSLFENLRQFVKDSEH